MANIRFWYENEWDEHTVVASTEHPNFPGSNTQLRWKTRPWRSDYFKNDAYPNTPETDGNFTITASNQNIYFNEGAGNLNAVIPAGAYTAQSLADEIETQMEATGAHNYSVYIMNYYGARFRIVDATATVNLLLSNQVNALWDTIGFTGVIDTGLLADHQADENRIHTEETLRMDLGSAAAIYGAFIFVDNLTSAATVKLQFSDDNWATVAVDYTMTKGDNCIAVVLPAAETYRYVGIYVEDRENPDNFVEFGRVWIGGYFEPKLGFEPNRSISKNDDSLISESEGGQVSTIQRAKYQSWNYGFGYAYPKATFDAMFAAVGTSRELVVQEKESTPTSKAFTDPEDRSWYCRLKTWAYKHLAGNYHELNITVVEER